MPIVDPTTTDAKPVKTDKGTVVSTDNGKVIVKMTQGKNKPLLQKNLVVKSKKDGYSYR